MDIEQTKQKIITVMNAHRGQARAVSNSYLAAAVGSSNDVVRQLVGDIVRERKANIGSHPDRGFFLIQDREDLELSNRQLISRLTSISERSRASVAMFDEAQAPDFEQGRLCLKQAMKAAV